MIVLECTVSTISFIQMNSEADLTNIASNAWSTYTPSQKRQYQDKWSCCGYSDQNAGCSFGVQTCDSFMETSVSLIVKAGAIGFYIIAAVQSICTISAMFVIFNKPVKSDVQLEFQ